MENVEKDESLHVNEPVDNGTEGNSEENTSVPETEPKPDTTEPEKTAEPEKTEVAPTHEPEPEPAPIPVFDAEVKETVEEVIERTPKKEVSWVVYLAILLLIVALIYVIRIAFYATEES